MQNFAVLFCSISHNRLSSCPTIVSTTSRYLTCKTITNAVGAVGQNCNAIVLIDAAQPLLQPADYLLQSRVIGLSVAEVQAEHVYGKRWIDGKGYNKALQAFDVPQHCMSLSIGSHSAIITAEPVIERSDADLPSCQLACHVRCHPPP